MQFVGRAPSACSFFERALNTMQKPAKAKEDPLVAFAIAGTVLAFLTVLDTDQLLFMVVGAVGYLCFHTLQKNTTPTRKSRKSKSFAKDDGAAETPRRATSKAKISAKEFRSPTAVGTDGRRPSAESTPRSMARAVTEKPFQRAQDDGASFCLDRRSFGSAASPSYLARRSQHSNSPRPQQPVAMPAPRMPPTATTVATSECIVPVKSAVISAPTFQANGLEAEIPELLAQIIPTPACDAAIARIVRSVSQAIHPLFPEAEVLGFATAKLTGSGAFGVAVPEVDLLIDVSPVALLRRLQRQAPGAAVGADGTAAFDEQKLQKHVLRKCAGRLVERVGFKFRRSAFGGQDPKVTLLLPVAAGLFTEPIPLDVAVNSAGPLRASALLTECGQIDARSKALILLVRRWAKDRGVSHAARGHLPPYAWSLLVVFFLQVGQADGPILPPFRLFKAGGAATVPKRKTGMKDPQLTVAQLFVDFFRFYAEAFNWQQEEVSVLMSRRTANSAGPCLTGETKDSGAIVVEDPFEPGRNLAQGVPTEARQRLRDEVARAHTMCSAACSLTELLEPWMPPEASAATGDTTSSQSGVPSSPHDEEGFASSL